MSKIIKPDSTAAAVIPARFGSTRFPGKVLADLCGKPVLRWVYENCAESGLFSRVIVATDHDDILRAAKSFGAEAVMTDASHGTGTERIAEVARSLTEKTIVNVQGDEPFLRTKTLKLLVKAAEFEGVEVATPVTSISEARELSDPGIVKVVFNCRHEALYFSRWPVPFDREGWRSCEDFRKDVKTGQPAPGIWWKHLGIYAFQREKLLELVGLPPTTAEKQEKLEQLRWLQHGVIVKCVVVDEKSIGIDTPADLEEARRFLRKKSG